MSHNKQVAKIRVLHIFDKIGMKGSPIHGGTRVLMTWWPEFQNTDYDLSLCVFRERTEGSLLLEQKGIYADYLARNKFDPRTVLDLMKLVKRKNIRILHCHGYGATNFGRIVGLICKVPVIVHEHMIDSRVPIYQKIADKVLAPFTTKGIAISEAVRKFMIGPRYIKDDIVEVVHNAIPAEYLNIFSNDEKKSIAKQHSVPLDKKLVGIVGRLNSVKGHIDFLYAVKIVLRTVEPPPYFLIVGEGELHQQLELISQQFGISKNVLFLGHCDDVLEVISLLDVLAICSHSEGFSLVAIEGMAQAKAIVATAVGGLPEVLEDRHTGLLVPPKSPEILAKNIEKLLKDDLLATTLGGNALHVCRQKFVVSEIVKKLTKIYEDVMQ